MFHCTLLTLFADPPTHVVIASFHAKSFAGNAIVDGIATSNFVQERHGLFLDSANELERFKYEVRG